MKKIICFIFLVGSSFLFAQAGKGDMAFSAGVTQQPVFNRHELSGQLAARYYLTDRLSAGTQMGYRNKKYSKGFGYPTNRTLLHVFTVGIPLQYDIVNSDKMILGLGAVQSVLFGTLRNRNDVTEEEYYDPDTGYTSVYLVPKRLNRDAYYVVTPYLDFSYKIIRIDESATLYANANMGYQLAFGKGDFSNARDFTNYVVSLGITIKGIID